MAVWIPKLFHRMAQNQISISYSDTTETEERINNETYWQEHTHSSDYEFWLYLSGEIQLLKEDHLYTPISGDIIYFAPGEKHRGIVQKPCMLSRIIIMISIEAAEAFTNDGFDILAFCRDAAANEKPCVLRMPAKEQQAMIQLLSEARKSFEAHSEYADVIGYSNFMRLFALLNETYFNSETDLFLPPSAGIIREACNYIDMHYTEIDNLSKIADELHVNYSYLSAKFSKKMTITMCDYLNYRRISRSRYLLASGKSVTEACFATGFSSMSYYIKLFKKLYGITPGTYAEQLKNAEK